MIPCRRTLLVLLLLALVSACTPIDQTPTSSIPTAAARATQTSPPSVPTIPAEAIRAYFTSAQGQKNETGALEEAVLADLNAAGRSIDMAMYNFSLRRVADALLAAKQRGVTVRVVADSDALDGSQFARLSKAGIQVIGDRHEGLMHNKFLVIDGQVVWTGSLNLTGSGTYQDDNNLVRFASPDLAENYTTEFEEMFLHDQFGPGSPANTPHPRLVLGGVKLENYFSPDDHVSARIAAALKTAQHSIDILAYSFTADPLAAALLERAKAGVQVRGVFDTDQYQSNTGGDFLRLKRAGLDVRLDGNPGLMHNKVLIIDQQVVIFGSYNFTASAEKTNDENVVVVYDPALASQFETEFSKVYGQAQP